MALTITVYFRILCRWPLYKWKCKHITCVICLDLQHFVIAVDIFFSMVRGLEKGLNVFFLHLRERENIILFGI